MKPTSRKPKARLLRATRSASAIPKVALLIETSNAYARGLLEGVQDYLRGNGPWSIHLAESGRGAVPPAWLQSWDGDGIIVRGENAAITRAVAATRLPLVNVSAAVLLEGMPCVETDDAEFARVAFEHFSERGFQNFAFCGDARFHWSTLRGEHFAKCVEQNGHSCHVFDAGEAVGDADVAAMAGWLAGLPKPLAVFACYDARGRQVLDACRRKGIAVPEEVAVLGVDNDAVLCELSPPPLSSIVPDARGAGRQAALLLDRMMAGEHVEPRMFLLPPTGVATRQSTDVLAVADRQVAQALNFIRREACRGIDVNDVAREAGLSRRLLETRFQALLKHTPHDEIMRVQLDRVKELLRQSGMTLAEIAERTGFRHVEYLSTVFRKRNGEPPSSYRLRHQGARK